MFDNPNYTKPRMGGAIGELLKGYSGAAQNTKQLANQSKALEFQDPNRPINQRDLMGLLLEDYKSYNATSQIQRAMNPSATIPPYNVADFFKNIQSALNGGGQPPTSAPALPSGVSTPAAPPAGGGTGGGIKVIRKVK